MCVYYVGARPGMRAGNLRNPREAHEMMSSYAVKRSSKLELARRPEPGPPFEPAPPDGAPPPPFAPGPYEKDTVISGNEASEWEADR